MEYYVVKSGMQMYDLSRAYGLGLILQKLSSSPAEVKDFGIYYLIEVQTKCNLQKVSSLAALLPQDSDRKWVYAFLTLNGKERVSGIKECEKLITDKRVISSILQKYMNVKQPEFFDSKKVNETLTLYQSLDLSATKGFREKIRGRVYREGNQLFIPKEDFLLSIIGHLNFTIWKWEKKVEQLIMILFNPSVDGILIGTFSDARDITRKIDELINTHRSGILSTLCYAALSLAKEISLQEERRLRFSSLIFGVMVGFGKQRKPKPYGGGVYPLDFLHKIIETSKNAAEIFDLWIDIFRKTNKPGYEELALYLSEFITYPSKNTLDRYLRSHLRMYLNKDIKPKLYEIEIIQEVLKNV